MTATPEELLSNARMRAIAAPEGDVGEPDPDWQRLALLVRDIAARGACPSENGAWLAAVEKALSPLRVRTASTHNAFTRMRVADIFAPLPPTRWLCEQLQWCPGRPAMFAGYGYSGKTLAAQSAALSIAAGRSIWGWFRSARTGKVLHVDHEQGEHATRKRYHRLAVGMGVDPAELEDRLDVVVHPGVFLNSPAAADVYARECDGVDLVVIDALRGATPGVDENDSKIRACIDVLGRVSEKTGAAFLVIHHAGKPNDNHVDPRTLLRGSSAIFDGCGSVFTLSGEKTEDGGSRPKRVCQAKSAAEADGGAVEPFYLAIEDVEADGDPRAGVRVVHKTAEQVKPPAPPGAELEDDCRRAHAYILQETVAGRAVAGKAAVASGAKMAPRKAGPAVDTLVLRGKVEDRAEKINGKLAPRLWAIGAGDGRREGSSAKGAP